MEEKQSQISTFIGMGLIFLLLYLWMQYSAPPKQEPAQENTQNTAPATPQSGAQNNAADPAATQNNNNPIVPDSLRGAVLIARFGAFAPAAEGKESYEVLENDLIRVTFTSKGGRIKEVFLKNFVKISADSAGADFRNPVRLLEDSKNHFEYELAVNGAGNVRTSDLFFTTSKSGNTLVFRADAGAGRYFEQKYTLSPDNYSIDYQIGGNGLNSILSKPSLRLNWVNYLDKLEKNQQYERTMSSVYYKAVDASADYCNCREDDSENLGEQPVKWFSHSNQFFNTSIIARFCLPRICRRNVDAYRRRPRPQNLYGLRHSCRSTTAAGMTIYTGPNEFDRCGNTMW
jgi:YidC/Oxa1 family membrane protein insertase